MTKHDLAYIIITQLKEHPDWLPTAIDAVFAGAKEAHSTLSRQCAQAEWAVMNALTLADPKRLDKGTKNLMNKKLIEYLSAPGCTAPIEKEALARYKKELEEK